MESSGLLKLSVLGLTIVAAMAVESCGPRQSGDKVVTINGVTYYFPVRELDGFMG